MSAKHDGEIGSTLLGRAGLATRRGGRRDRFDRCRRWTSLTFAAPLRRLAFPLQQTARDVRQPTRSCNASVRAGMALDPLPACSRSITHWVAASIGLPARNGPVWAVVLAKDEEVRLPGAIRHLIDQGVDHVVVADNGSTDGTADVVAAMADDLPITLLQDLEPGYYRGAQSEPIGACRDPPARFVDRAVRRRRAVVRRRTPSHPRCFGAATLTSTRPRCSITVRRSMDQTVVILMSTSSPGRSCRGPARLPSEPNLFASRPPRQPLGEWPRDGAAGCVGDPALPVPRLRAPPSQADVDRRGVPEDRPGPLPSGRTSATRWRSTTTL